MSDALSSRAAHLRRLFFASWIGQGLSAALLPGWLLLLAASDHGTAIWGSLAQSALFALAVVAGLAVLALWLWSRDRPGALQGLFRNWTSPVDASKSFESIWSLVGAAAFFAACFQVLANFDVFSSLAIETGLGRPSSWSTLFVLSAIQFVCFFAHARSVTRPRTAPPTA